MTIGITGSREVAELHPRHSALDERLLVQRWLSWEIASGAEEDLWKQHGVECMMEVAKCAIMEMIEQFPALAAEAVLNLLKGEKPSREDVKEQLSKIQGLMTARARAKWGIGFDSDGSIVEQEEQAPSPSPIVIPDSGKCVLVTESTNRGEKHQLPEKLYMLRVTDFEDGADGEVDTVNMALQSYRRED